MPPIDTSIEGGPATGITVNTPGLVPATPIIPPPANAGPSMFDRLAQTNLFTPTNPLPTYDPNSYINQAGPGIQPIQTPAFDNYVKLMAEMPEHEGPGVLKRIAASMMALNDPRLAMTLLNQPSAELVDWQNRVNAAERAAQIEQRFLDLEDRRLGRESNTEIQRKRIEQQDVALAFDKLKYDNPEMQLIKPESGNYKVYNPRTGEVSETTFSTGALSPEEEAALEVKTEREIEQMEHDFTLSEIEARSESSRKTAQEQSRLRTSEEETRQQNRVNLETLRQQNRLERGTTSEDKESETDRRKRIANNAREYLMNNPEDEGYIEINGDDVTVKPVGTGRLWGGIPELTKEKRDAIVQAIQSGGGVSSTTLVPNDRVVVEKDGQQFTLPRKQLAQAISQGYVEVK